MNNSCVSLIVPVYNAAKYLSGCVNSLLNQNFADFELILVNDGSTDDSLAVCKDFERRDSRVFVINEDNQGASSARNHGIKVAKGDYICFVDADDYINPSYLEELVRPALQNDKIDLVLQGRIKCEREKQTKIVPDSDGLYSLKEDFGFFENVNLFRFCAVYSKLFKRDIIQNHEISFSKTLNHGEDFDFLAQYLLYCDSVQVSTCANYYYMINDGSL
jgi:glycosyltransferase involved in cell wall biosynthesis